MGKIIPTLLWLIHAEDSNDRETRKQCIGSFGNTRTEGMGSIVKCLVWYVVAVVVTLLLAKLH